MNVYQDCNMPSRPERQSQRRLQSTKYDEKHLYPEKSWKPVVFLNRDDIAEGPGGLYGKGIEH